MSRDAPTRRLAAILVLDVVGYSKLMEADEVGTLAAVNNRLDDIVKPIVDSHGGRVVKLLGDGALIEFSSALSAVSAAVDIQNRMAKANMNETSDKRISLRAGINLADVIDEGGDIFGEGVNVAARLEALAEPGAVLISEKVYAEIRGKLDLDVNDEGTKSLKNISLPVRAFSIGRRSGAKNLNPDDSRRAPREVTTVAVLPFANAAGTTSDDFFIDGITEDIATELSKIRDLSLVARSTAFSYRVQTSNATDIGRRLGAEFVVAGSVRISTNRLRATVQLIDVARGVEVFADRFDREISDVFALQDEIVDAIVGRLFFNLHDVAAEERSRNPSTSLTAYTYWLRAGAALRKGDEDNARKELHKAVEVDGQYGPALAVLGLLYSYLRFSHADRHLDEERKEISMQFASKAIAVEKNDPFILATVASASLLNGRVSEAIRFSSAAISLSPRDINVMLARGMILSYAGEHDNGLALAKRACAAEPLLPPTFISSLGDCYYLARRFDEALDAYRRLVDPPFYFALNEATCLAHLGNIDDANQLVRQIPSNFDMETYAHLSAAMCATTSDRELMLEGFRLAGVAV